MPFRNSQELANFSAQTERSAMGPFYDQLESKARIEHTAPPKRGMFYRQSRRRPACLHQTDEEAFSPSLKQGSGFLAGSDLTPNSG